MIRGFMLALAQWSFNPRGKHFLLRKWDQFFGPTAAVTPTGVRLLVRLGSPQDLTFMRDPRSDNLAQHVSALPVGGVFIDVGANIGYYSILARRAVGKSGLCIACEPSRREFLQLVQHLAANESTNVIAANVALGEEPGVAMLLVDPYHTGLNNVAFESIPSESASRSEPCLVLTCDEVVAAVCPGREIALLKIDVEGAELVVLKGADRILSEGLVRAVFVEVTDAFLRRHGQSSEELYAFMEARSYYGLVGRRVAYQYDETFVRREATRSGTS